MVDKNKFLFRLSLVFNIILISLLGLWLYKKGGISYLFNKFSSLQSRENQTNSRDNKIRQHTYNTPYYIQKFERFQGLPDSREDIIFVGDSLTDQGEWSELIKNAKIKNRGISGDTTDGIINRLDEVIDGKPQKIFILIGTNDFWKEDKPVNAVVQNYKIILTKIKEATPSTQVYIQSVLPINNQQYSIPINSDKLITLNKNLQALAQEFSYQYIDLYQSFLDKNNQLDIKYTPDGAHLNSQGYLLWKRIIEPYVKE